LKSIKLLYLIVATAIVFFGCQPVTESKKDIAESVEPDIVEDIAIRKIEASTLPANVLDWTEVSRYTGDVDGDGANENVVLVTEAKKDKNGEFLWNDGQNWALFVDGSDKDYVLFQNYVNIGNAYFEVSDYYMADGAVPRINLILSTGAAFCVKSYVFSPSDATYGEQMLYDSGDETEGGISRRHSSIPIYFN